MSGKNQIQGFAMLELLVSLLVLSIGLLGIAGLQLTSLKTTQNAYYRSLANVVAYDMIDRMKSNQPGVANNSYDNVDTASAGSNPNCAYTTVGCSTNQQAANDIYEWATNYVSLLPSGTGTVTRSGDVFTVTVSWFDPASADQSTKNVEIKVQL
jgi:type IV pilus assembly protein PilV